VTAFAWPARVYWEDTDGGGIVYYANYLRFLERARTEWLRSLGHSQQQLLQDAGIVFTVVSLEIGYRAPARLDDELRVTCEPRSDGASCLEFAQRIYRDKGGLDLGREAGQLLTEASVRVACVDARTLRPRRLPEFLLEALAAAGEAHG
jgi:acyl-CoA thioester hydrolase